MSDEPNPTLAELAALGDRSPDDQSIRETLDILHKLGETLEYDFPLSRRKVIELTESVLALRAALRDARAALAAATEEQERLERRVKSLEDAEAAECGCDSPVCAREGTLPEALATAAAQVAALREALENVQHNRDCSCYGHSQGHPCDRCTVGYDAVDAALARLDGRTEAER